MISCHGVFINYNDDLLNIEKGDETRFVLCGIRNSAWHRVGTQYSLNE